MKSLFEVNVDVDGVLSDTMQLALALNLWKTGQMYKMHDITDFFFDDGNFDLKTFIEKHVLHDDVLILAPVVSGSQQALRAMTNAGIHVRIATARREQFIGVTKLWLDMQNIWYNEYVSLGNNSKSTLPGNVLIDDYWVNLDEFVDSGDHRYGILFPRPWNKAFAQKLSRKYPTKIILPNGNDDAQVWHSILYSITKLAENAGVDRWLQDSF